MTQPARSDWQRHDQHRNPGGQLNVLEVLGRKQKLVTRSTYAAELRNAVESTSDVLEIALYLHELKNGNLTANELLVVKESGKLSYPITLCIDNRSVFDSVTGSDVTCTDKSMVMHARALREFLDNRIIEYIMWIDTRDMLADALTKGKIDKQMLNTALNQGLWELGQLSAVKSWQPKRLQQ